MRRARAFLVTGVLWGVAWSLLSVVPGVLDYLTFDAEGVFVGFDLFWRVMLTWFIILGLTGALSGVGFAALLSRAERERSIDELSLRRVGIWGGVAGFVMPLLGVVFIEVATGGGGTPVIAAFVVAGLSGLLGAGAAVTSLKAAQRAVGPGEDAQGMLGQTSARSNG